MENLPCRNDALQGEKGFVCAKICLADEKSNMIEDGKLDKLDMEIKEFWKIQDGSKRGERDGEFLPKPEIA